MWPVTYAWNDNAALAFSLFAPPPPLRVSYTDRAANSVDQQLDGSVQSGTGMPVPAAVAATGTPPIAYMAQPPFPMQPGMMPPFVAMPPGKPGDPQYSYPSQIVYVMAPPPHPMQGQDGEHMGYPAMYPVAAMPYAHPSYGAPYMMAHRPDGQMQQMVIAAPPPNAAHYAYPAPPPPQVMYSKPPSRDASQDMGGAQVMDPNGRRDMRMGDGMAGGHHNGK